MPPRLARVLRAVRRHPGLVLAAVLCAPWLFGSSEPAWGGVAVGVLLLAGPVLVVRGVLLLLDDLRRAGRRP